MNDVKRKINRWGYLHLIKVSREEFEKEYPSNVEHPSITEEKFVGRDVYVDEINSLIKGESND